MGHSRIFEQGLASIREIIETSPDSETAMDEVRKTLDSVIEEFRHTQRFSIEDFVMAVRAAIIGVGFTRKGITDIQLLDTLAETVPYQLGVEIVFPEIREGKRGLWSYDSVTADVGELRSVFGDSYCYNMLSEYGLYALRVTGLFADFLLPKRKMCVGIKYYEMTGAEALTLAAQNPVARDTEKAKALAGLAANFPAHRRVLNEAGGLIGTPARRTVAEELIGLELNATGNRPRGDISTPKAEDTALSKLPTYNATTRQFYSGQEKLN